LRRSCLTRSFFLAQFPAELYYFSPHRRLETSMALVPIKTASATGYCDCIHGCYELASLRDEDTGKGYCPRCAKEHLDLNKGIGLPQPAPSKIVASDAAPSTHPLIPATADPPGRLH
jgi:hypothetical protein